MVSFAEFWVELPKRINARCCSIEDVKREQRVWVEEQIKEIELSRTKVNTNWQRAYFDGQLTLLRNILGGLV